MHRFQSLTAVRRMRQASFLVCARYILIPATLGGLIYALLSPDQRIALYALALFPVTVVVVILQVIFSARTNCPLCMTPVLGFKSCNKHIKARSLFGSHKLRVALNVVFCSSFRCPYCNEPSVLKSRSNRL